MFRSEDVIPPGFPRHAPDLLALGRCVFGLAFVIAGWLAPISSVFVALALAIAVTDWLDGPLARRLGVADEQGAILDVCADKVAVLSAFIGLGIAGRLSAALVGLVIVREVVVLCVRAWAWRRTSVTRPVAELVHLWLQFFLVLAASTGRVATWAPLLLALASLLTSVGTIWSAMSPLRRGYPTRNGIPGRHSVAALRTLASPDPSHIAIETSEPRGNKLAG